jgi:hypothetical protein
MSNLSGWKQNRSITPEEFVKAFTENDTYEAIAKKLNISVSAVRNRAYALKRSGVNLNTSKKKASGSFFGSKKLDEKNVLELNKMIDESNK